MIRFHYKSGFIELFKVLNFPPHRGNLRLDAVFTFFNDES